MRKICVIIPVFKREFVFENISLARRSADGCAELRFIVVDNGNPPPLRDRLASLAETDRDVSVLRLEHNQGGAGAYAAGMTAALDTDCDGMWLLDDDAAPDRDTLRELLGAFDAISRDGGNPGAVASTLLSNADPERIIESGAFVRGLYGKLCAGYKDSNIRAVPAGHRRCDYAAAASILIPADAVRKVGVFARTFIHYDDVEWCFRAAGQGYEIYVSTRSCVHHPDWSANFSGWLRYYNTRNKLWFLRRYRRRQWFFSEILLRVKAVFFACTGHWTDAKLMFLGMKHAADGTLLLRNEVEALIR